MKAINDIASKVIGYSAYLPSGGAFALDDARVIAGSEGYVLVIECEAVAARRTDSRTVVQRVDAVSGIRATCPWTIRVTESMRYFLATTR